MRVVPTTMSDAWASGEFTGPNRPIARVTVQRTAINTQKVNTLYRWASYIFGNPHPMHELPNVKAVRWNRSIDQDAATCELDLFNVAPLPIGQAPILTDDGVYEGFEQRGYFTFNRGDDTTNRWNHTPTEWTHKLYPDMIVRTYEGYGFDETVPPDQDPHLVQTGTWFIDDVILDAIGTFQLKMRDASVLLMEQIAFLPVIPTGSYPLSFEHIHTVPGPDSISVSGSTTWKHPAYSSDSGIPYNGANGSIGGHRPSDAFDGSSSTYWLSIGNDSPSSPYAYEYVEGKITAGTVNAFKVNVRGGPYTMYLSVYANGAWQGKSKVPYDPTNPVSAPNGSDIKYLRAVTVDNEATITVKLPKPIANATKVRVTFHHLWDSNYGTYQFRAGVRDFQVAVGTTTTTTTPTTKTVGNYNDYTDIVKRLCCFAGFWWPNIASTGYMIQGDNSERSLVASPDDPAIVAGKAWGDFEQSGTYGPTDLTSDIFDKKPLMDGVSYVRDMLGFIFFIDEAGGAVFRSPNIWELGNIVMDNDNRLTTSLTRTTDMITIDEKQTLMGLQVTLSSRNVRERIVIANVSGGFGAVTKGFNPYNMPLTGFRRVAIWSDQHFASVKECQIMADLIALRQLFTFRSDKVTIPGYPAIQMDDQVQLVERVTEETEVHYVMGIASSNDISSGEWTYTLDTHWLGKSPFGNWVFNPANLAPDTQDYLRALGKIT